MRAFAHTSAPTVLVVPRSGTMCAATVAGICRRGQSGLEASLEPVGLAVVVASLCATARGLWRLEAEG